MSYSSIISKQYFRIQMHITQWRQFCPSLVWSHWSLRGAMTIPGLIFPKPRSVKKVIIASTQVYIRDHQHTRKRNSPNTTNHTVESADSFRLPKKTQFRISSMSYDLWGNLECSGNPSSNHSSSSCLVIHTIHIGGLFSWSPAFALIPSCRMSPSFRVGLCLPLSTSNSKEQQRSNAAT